jgi:hypothetical protein
MTFIVYKLWKKKIYQIRKMHVTTAVTLNTLHFNNKVCLCIWNYYHNKQRFSPTTHLVFALEQRRVSAKKELNF